MELLIGIIISILFITGVIGAFIPVIPDMLPLWIGVLSFELGPFAGDLGYLFWIGLILITVINILADFVSNAYFVNRAGGTKNSIIAAFFGLVLGMIILPPFGILLGPFIAVLLVEIYDRENLEKSLRVAVSTIIAFAGSGLVKMLLQLIIIFWFIFEVFIF